MSKLPTPLKKEVWRLLCKIVDVKPVVDDHNNCENRSFICS